MTGYYGIGVSPVDGSIWGSVLSFPGAVVRVSPGDNPPETALTEIFEVPWNEPKAAVNGYGPRGGHRSQRRLDIAGERPSRELRPAQMQGPLNGPTATGSTVLKAGHFTHSGTAVRRRNGPG